MKHRGRAPSLSDVFRPRWPALVIWAAGFVSLFLGQHAVGFVRDESVYFAAGESYARWFELLFRAPGAAFSDPVIVRFFGLNHEHPVLMKTLYGLSEALFHRALGWTGAGAGFRIPAFAMAALIPALLYAWGQPLFGRTASLFAALSFFLVPRQFFNAELACFDMPIAAMWLVTVYAFARARTTRWGWLGCGVAFGLALCTKHNALFLPFVLAPFALWNVWLAWKAGGDRREILRALAPLLAMAVLGPAIFYRHWPFLWHHPTDRIAWYLAFHAQHNHYAWFYLGELLRAPPFPLAYVIVVTALTVPLTLFVPIATGFISLVGRCFARAHRPSWTELLIGANAIASIAIISHPSVPHFGGVKHWLPSMPFLALLGGTSVARVTELLPTFHRKWTRLALSAAVFALLLGPAAIGLARIDPYGTSFYSELAGGLPGAASLGMQRQFWSNNVTGVLPWINAHAPREGRLYLHEVNGYSFRDYQTNGMLRPDLRPSGPAEADIAAYQYHQEFREQELEIWNAFGTERPATGLYVDETPQVMVYKR